MTTPRRHPYPITFARVLTICATLLLATASRGQPVIPEPEDSPIAAAPDTAPLAPAPAASIAAQNEQNLRAEIALLKSQLNAAAQKNDNAAAELNAASAALKTENADLRIDIQKREDERGALIQKLAAAQLALQKKEKADDTNAATAVELTKARLNIDALNTQVQNLTDENQRLAAQIDEAKTRATQATGEAAAKLDDTQKQLDAAQKELADTRDENTSLQSKLTDAQTKAQSLENSLADASAQLKTAAAERDKALAEGDTAKSASDTALADMTKERDTLAQRLSALKKQNAASADEATTEAGRLREKLAAVGETMTTLRLAEKTSQEELEKARKAQADAEARAAELTSQLAAAGQQPPAPVSDAGEPNAAASQQLAETKQQLTETTQQRDDAKQQLDDANKQLTDTKQQLADTKQQLADTTKQLAEAASQLSVAKDSQPLYEKVVAQLSLARDTLRQAQEQVTQLADENTRLKEGRAATPATPTAAVAGAATSATTDMTAAVATATTTTTSTTAASPSAEQSQAQAQSQMHAVVFGDTLSTISRQYYGTVAYWQDIYDANRDQLATPDALKPGMKLRIP